MSNGKKSKRSTNGKASQIDTPRHINCERAVIGSIIFDPGIIDGVIEVLGDDGDRFEDRDAGTLYEALVAVYREQREVNYVEAIARTNLRFTFADQCLNSASSPGSWRSYAKFVLNYSLLRERKLLESRQANELEQLAAEGSSGDVAEMLARHSEELRQLAADGLLSSKYECLDKSEWRLPPPKIEYLFRDRVPLGISAGVNAAGGTGKSTLTLTLAMSAATGRTLLSPFNPCGESRVLMFLPEDQSVWIHRRYDLLARHYDFSENNHTSFDENVQIYTEAEPLIRPNYGALSFTSFKMRVEHIIDTWQPRFIVLDPLSFFRGVDENDNTAAAMLGYLFQEWSGRVEGGAVVWTLHHTSKMFSNSPKADSGRGASAAKDAQRLLFTLTAPNANDIERFSIDDPFAFVKLDMVKSNYSALDCKTYWYQRSSENALVPVDMDDRVGELKEMKTDSVLRRIIEYIGPDNPNNLTRNMLRSGDHLNEIGATQKEVETAVDHGLAKGFLDIEKVGQRPRIVVLKSTLITEFQKGVSDESEVSDTPCKSNAANDLG